MKVDRCCQPCTACCDGWVRIEVKGCEAYPGKPCPHSTGAGCDDYKNRPKNPCQIFECAWVKSDSYLPDNFRPDECGALVQEAALTWQEIDVDVIVPVGKKIPDETLNWFKQYAEQSMRPFIYQEQKPNRRKLERNPPTYAFGPPAFQQWVMAAIDRGEKLW